MFGNMLFLVDRGGPVSFQSNGHIFYVFKSAFMDLLYCDAKANGGPPEVLVPIYRGVP